MNLEFWISLVTLTVLEIILGIDNLVFITITTNRLPASQQKQARRLGLLLAIVMRLLLLAAASWLAQLTTPWISFTDFTFSGRDIFFLLGGLFLLYKATQEIHHGIAAHDKPVSSPKPAKFAAVIVQIMLLDMVFSIDSVITAVGMAQDYSVMALAIIIAVLLMIFASEVISRLLQQYPSLKMLALSFLLLVGIMLMADACHFHVPRAYLYFAMAFSLGVETLNIVTQRRGN